MLSTVIFIIKKSGYDCKIVVNFIVYGFSSHKQSSRESSQMAVTNCKSMINMKLLSYVSYKQLSSPCSALTTGRKSPW